MEANGTADATLVGDGRFVGTAGAALVALSSAVSGLLIGRELG